MFDTDSENLKIKEDSNDIIEIKNKDIFITLKDRKSIGLYGYFDIEFDEKPFNKFAWWYQNEKLKEFESGILEDTFKQICDFVAKHIEL